MYYYVKDQKSIASAFADCLGGLVSSAAKNVVLKVAGQNGAKVIAVTTNFKKKSISAHLVEIDLEDIDIGESRNLPISIELPRLASVVKDSEVVKITVQYLVVNTKETKTETKSLLVERTLPVEQGGQKTVKTAEDLVLQN